VWVCMCVCVCVCVWVCVWCVCVFVYHIMFAPKGFDLLLIKIITLVVYTLFMK